MKKFFVILLAVCLVATFISCSNEAKVDERVNVSFGVDQTRSLSSSASYADFSTLDWWYKATTESEFNYGEKEAWTKLNEGLDTTLELSQGIWNFQLCAVARGADPGVNGTTLVYSGSRNGVLVQKGSNAQQISIEVIPGGSGNGTIVISSNIAVNKKTENGFVASTVKANNWEVKAKGTSSTFVTQNGVFSGDKTIEGVPAGDYTVTVWYKDVLDEEADIYVIRATDPIDVTVYANSTITVTGSIDEETQAVVIRPINSYQAVADSTVAKTEDAVITVPVTPAMSSSSSEKTTVKIPSAVYSTSTGNNVDISLGVTVTPIAEASSNEAFQISSSTNAAVAAIDLNLRIGTAPMTNFGESTVEVTTYIAKGLSNVKVSYGGEEIPGATYDEDTGKLVFTTTHFSTFVVESTSVALIGDTAYATLESAFGAVNSGETIILLKDSTGNGIKVPSESNFTVDFNSFTYTIDGTTVGSTGTETNGFQLLKDSTITFKNGKLTSSKAYILIQNYSNLTLDNMYLDGSARGVQYTLSNNNGNVVIKDTTITAAEGNVAFDVCRYASYIGPEVTVEGNSVIKGKVEISSSGAKDGAIHKLNVTGGIFEGEIYTYNSPNFVKNISGGTFYYNPSNYLADGALCTENGGVFIVTSLTTDNAGAYEIGTSDELVMFAKLVNEKGKNFSGKTVKLVDNIDLAGIEWNPIGQTGATQFIGTFDGQNYTIKNLTINNTSETDNCATGLFGWLNSATVKNVIIDTANVYGHHNVGVIAGYLETSGCTIENCHVKNATVSCTSVNDDANGDKCGGIVGHAGNDGVKVNRCTVTNSTISAGRDAGQVVGAAKVANVTGCSATSVTVTANGSSTGANIRAEIIGRTL